MQEYIYVKRKEIKSYQDIVDAVDGFILEDACGTVAVDKSAFFRKSEQFSIDSLNDYINQGGKVYARIKEYHKPVFDKSLDNELETLLYDFVNDWELTDYGDDSCVEKVLRRLKEIFKEYQASLDEPLCEGWQGPESCNKCEMLDCNCNPKHKEEQNGNK